MACKVCGSKKAKVKIINNYKFDISGLSRVYLNGVEVIECPDCDEVFYNYGNLIALNRIIAEHLILKPTPLIGEEIVFLRKYLGLDAKEMAQRLGITHFTYSKYENDKLSASKPVDQLIRFIARDGTPDRNYNLHDRIEEIRNAGGTSKNLKIDVHHKIPKILEGVSA